MCVHCACIYIMCLYLYKNALILLIMCLIFTSDTHYLHSYMCLHVDDSPNQDECIYFQDFKDEAVLIQQMWF